MISYFNKLYTNNKWVKSSSSNYYKFTNLKNVKVKVVISNKKDISKISKNAYNGYNIWTKKTSKKKSLIIKKISDLIKSNRLTLAKAENNDTGKNLKQCLEEINYCSSLWKHASLETGKIKDKILKINKKTYCKISQEAVGVTVLIVPWNFPLIVLSERLPYILGAGCSVIVKPSEFASESIIKFFDLLKKSNLPKGVLNLVLGDGKYTGSTLIKAKNVKMISFTGSTENGKKIMKSASEDLKRVSLELGGKNPFILFDKKNLKKAVENLVLSFTHNAGQACVGVSKVYVKEEIFLDFQNELKNYFNYFSNFNYQISNYQQYLKIYNFIKKIKFNKNQIIFKKKLKKMNKKNIFYPMILKNLKKKNPLDETEIFGPILNVHKFKNENVLKKELNLNNYGLSCIIWTNNIKKSENFVKNLRYGRVWINGNIKQNYPQIPIGGFNWSGIGRETGKSGIVNYSEIRSTIFNKI